MNRRKYRKRSKKPKNSNQTQQPETEATEVVANVEEDVTESDEEMDKKSEDSDEPQQQQEPDDIPNENQINADEDTEGWESVDSKKHTRSQRGASSSAGRSQVSPHALGSNTGQQTPYRHTNKDEATANSVTVQTEFLESITNESDLKCTGFRDKKWMFARRFHNDREDQNLIYVSFNNIVYAESNHNWVKVGAVVLPFLVENELMHQQIIDSGIYGCFLYTNMVNRHQDGRGNGPLHYVRIVRSANEIFNHGLINGVFPYYTGLDYRVMVEFNADRDKKDTVQPRFNYKNNECEPGIEELMLVAAYDQLEYRSKNNIVYRNPQPDRHYSAIYVSKYASLVVFFTNKKVDVETRIDHGQLYSELSKSNDKKDRERLNEKKILKQKEGFHERFLIQGGGVVSIYRYPLYFKFMSHDDSQVYEFKKLDTTVSPLDDVNDLKSKLSGIRFPLIELKTVNDPERKAGVKMSHFAGYLLEIQNYEIEIEDTKIKPRAILQIPTDGDFNAYEVGGNEDNNEVDGLKFIDKQWHIKGAKKVYKHFTGPTVSDDGWSDTPDGAHEDYKRNDGSIREAFPKSDKEYLGRKVL